MKTVTEFIKFAQIQCTWEKDSKNAGEDEEIVSESNESDRNSSESFNNYEKTRLDDILDFFSYWEDTIINVGSYCTDLIERLWLSVNHTIWMAKARREISHYRLFIL